MHFTTHLGNFDLLPIILKVSSESYFTIIFNTQSNNLYKEKSKLGWWVVSIF